VIKKIAANSMKPNYKALVWLSAGGIGLLVLVVFIFFNTPRSISKESSVAPTAQPFIATAPSIAEVSNSPTAETTGIRLPAVDYPPGSVGQACSVNDFPSSVGYFDLDSETRLNLENSPYDSNGEMKPLAEECLMALERHIYPLNPYLWSQWRKERNSDENYLVFAFVNIDNPLTFERLFTDPVTDLARVKDALARPECQLGQDASPNWNLNETCHADAILNYALVMRFCFADFPNDGVSTRNSQPYWKEDNPTPEQDRSNWIETLESYWIREKCKTLDPNLDLQAPLHADLRKQIQALLSDESLNADKSLNATLIDLAARLGDPNAGLTHPSSVMRLRLIKYSEEGYKYGPLAGWFTNVFKPTDLFLKHPPSVDRMRYLISLFGKNLFASDGKLINFDHEALVQHLCTPPYYYRSPKDPPEPPSCREIINKLREESLTPSQLEEIAAFEDVAMRLDVYE